MICVNCGKTERLCLCTWPEISKAFELLRRRAAETRRRAGKPTVVERGLERQGLPHFQEVEVSDVGAVAEGK